MSQKKSAMQEIIEIDGLFDAAFKLSGKSQGQLLGMARNRLKAMAAQAESLLVAQQPVSDQPDTVIR